MLIEKFEKDWISQLNTHALALPRGSYLYLLLDGACVPGLHDELPIDRKNVLFDFLPGCNRETRNFSPFLTPYEAYSQQPELFLSRCNGWPMVSAIDTSETLEELAARLAAWCVVDADGQNFNFRFADTRRLPVIIRILNLQQRKQLTGPMGNWRYIGRDGKWCELDVTSSFEAPVDLPSLNFQQFSAMVADSVPDEFMVLLQHRNCMTFARPFQSHALVVSALVAAQTAGLADGDRLDWCEWYWKQDRITDPVETLSMLKDWEKGAE